MSRAEELDQPVEVVRAKELLELGDFVFHVGALELVPVDEQVGDATAQHTVAREP